MKYFISYTTRDKEITRSLLESLSSILKRTGEVFVDLIDNDSLNKQTRVMAELDTSDLLILVETPSVFKSDWVLIEIERAKWLNIPIHSMTIGDINQLLATDVIPSRKSRPKRGDSASTWMEV